MNICNSGSDHYLSVQHRIMPRTCRHIKNGRKCRHGCTAFVTVCHEFVRAGNCSFGDRCRFSHPDQEQRVTCRHRKNGRECPHGCTAFVTVCHHFVRAGNCSFGDGCRLFHPDQEQSAEQNEQNAAQEPSNAQQEPETVTVRPAGPRMLRALQDLGMNTDTSFSLWEVKKAYRAAAVIHHPDKGGVSSDFRSVHEAYEFLGALFRVR